MTINGTPVSLGKDGKLVIGTSTVDLGGARLSAFVGPMTLSGGLGAVLTLNGQVATAYKSGGLIIIRSITLTPGGPASTVSGSVLSAGPSGLVIVGSRFTSSFSFSVSASVTGSSSSPKGIVVGAQASAFPSTLLPNATDRKKSVAHTLVVPRAEGLFWTLVTGIPALIGIAMICL
jgi:hypothetical protein